MLIKHPITFDRSVELIIRTNQRNHRRRGEKLGIRSGSKKSLGILRVEDLAGLLRNHFDTPESAFEFGIRQSRIDAAANRLYGFPRRRLQLRYKQQTH